MCTPIAIVIHSLFDFWSKLNHLTAIATGEKNLKYEKAP